MPEELLPLFPLGVVLFPGTPLPLHIFEERYKLLVGEAVRDLSEFGIVLANESGIVNAGCTARVEQILKQYTDGRMDILAMGRRRFRLFVPVPLPIYKNAARRTAARGMRSTRVSPGQKGRSLPG